MPHHCTRPHSDPVRETRHRWGNRGAERGRIYPRPDKVPPVYLRPELQSLLSILRRPLPNTMLSQPGSPAMLGVGEGRTGEERRERVRISPRHTQRREQIPRKPSGWPGPSADCRRWQRAWRLPWRLSESQRLFLLRLWEVKTYLGSSCAQLSLSEGEHTWERGMSAHTESAHMCEL